MESKGKILVIDDEVGIQRGCRRALEPEGFAVEVAHTLNEGLQKILDNHFDLILLDVMMPDGRGTDLLEPIFEKDPDTVCVIITGFTTVELAISAIKLGAYDFISKPFSSDLLLMTVDQGLEKRRLSLESKKLQIVEQEAVELARAKEEMEKLEQAKSAFMLTVAHELRTPVGATQSLLRTLTRGLAGELNEQQRDILFRIEDRFDLLMELINDLLSLASSKSFDFEKPLEVIELKPIIQEVIDRFSVQVENKKISINLEIEPEDLELQATTDGLDKVLSNLIGNAIKYSHENGVVQVKVHKRSNIVAISVSDTGIGIPEADIPHLWDEFFRAKNARHSGIVGTGLGLSIVKQIVDQFGWKIKVKSVEEEGSTFTITFPNNPSPTLSVQQ